MKNVINHYYGLNAFDMRKVNDNYMFSNKKNVYWFYKIDNLDGFYRKINLILATTQNPYVHTLIRNRENKVLTFDGINYYALFKVNMKYNREIDATDVCKFNKNICIIDGGKKNTSFSWIDLWTKKVDYLEHYIEKKDDWSDDLKCLFNYYIGIAENSIEYLKTSGTEFVERYRTDYFGLAHERVNCFDTLYDFYNPVNFVIDNRTRDMAEYLKSLFFCKRVEVASIEKMVGSTDYSRREYILLVSRILFPTFFLDSLEQCAFTELPDTKILELYDYAVDYQNFVNLVVMVINKQKKVDIPIIKWMTKN